MTGIAGAAAGRRTAWHVAALTAVSLAMFLFRSASLPLADPEEARCALTVREMLRSGDWLVPRLEGRPYVDKPAPFFWLAAAAQVVTGDEELAGRLVAALGGLAGVLATYAIGRRAFGPTAGLLAGLVLATSGQYLFMARWYRMDMPFAAAVWWALVWFWRAESRRPGATVKPWRTGSGWYGFYALCGVATALKGPAGLVLPAMALLGYFLLSRQARRWLDFIRTPGVLLYLAIAASWYVAVSIRQPGYVTEFLIRHNIQRYAGRVGYSWPFYVYLPTLIVGLLPWTIYLPGAVIRYFPRRWRARSDRPDVLFLWLAALVPVVFFSLAGTRLPGYILPAYPPLAVLIGGLVAEWVEGGGHQALLKAGARAVAIAAVVIPLAVGGLEYWLGALDAWIALLVAVECLAAWRMIAAIRRDNRKAFCGWAVGAAAFGFLFAIGHTAPAGYDLLSTRRLARLVPREAAADATFYFWPSRKLSFLYYAGVPAVRNLDGEDPAHLAHLAADLASSRPVYCLVSGAGNLALLEGACQAPLRILGRSGSRWLVVNHGPLPATQSTGMAAGGLSP